VTNQVTDREQQATEAAIKSRSDWQQQQSVVIDYAVATNQQKCH